MNRVQEAVASAKVGMYTDSLLFIEKKELGVAFQGQDTPNAGLGIKCHSAYRTGRPGPALPSILDLVGKVCVPYL